MALGDKLYKAGEQALIPHFIRQLVLAIPRLL